MVVKDGILQGILTAKQALAEPNRSVKARSIMTQDVLHIRLTAISVGIC